MKVRSIFTVVIAVLIFALATLGARAAASAPRLLITWRAMDSVAPSAYPGKILPGVNTPIVASVEVISGGNMMNLKPYDVDWYLDDNLMGGGAGKQTITLNAPGYAKIMKLMVTVPNYPGGLLVGTTHIQMVGPHMVIVAPYPGGLFSQPTVQVQAIPYFFKTSDLGKLSFQWTVNNQAVTTQEDPENLTVNLGGSTPDGYSLSIGLLTKQSNDPFLNDHASVVLTKTI